MNTSSFPFCAPTNDFASDSTLHRYIVGFVLAFVGWTGFTYLEGGCGGGDMFYAQVAVIVGMLGAVWTMTYLYVHYVATAPSRRRIEGWNRRYKKPVLLTMIFGGFALVLWMGWHVEMGNHLWEKVQACGL